VGQRNADAHFIHIEDCVEAVLVTVDQIDNGDALNLSTGILTSFIEFARMAADLCGFHPEIRGMSDKPGGVHARGDDTRKQIALGVRHRTPLRSGVERALAHYAK
jgi:nucleoside-diphosphate-sugar epimerase